MALAVVRADVRAARAFGRLLREGFRIRRMLFRIRNGKLKSQENLINFNVLNLKISQL
jgi:hypothetical protein